MIQFFIGTKAQFIKMAPIMAELQHRNIAFRYIDSGQHGDFTRSLRQVFKIREPDFSFSDNKRDITSIASALRWAVRLSSYCIFGKKWLREKVFPGGGICLVHGDTMSTLLGVSLARAAGLEVGHVEAGLRSYDYLHPFPEELIRVYCMKRCNVLFAPSADALSHLNQMNVPGKVIPVDGNTVVDALHFAETVPATISIPQEPYALAACHRLETITNRNRLERVVSLINRVSEELPVIFVTHKPTRRYLTRYNLHNRLSSDVKIMEMQDYVSFTALMRNAKMVLADGGSIQEECSYLCKPCLVLRNKTERCDGIGINAMLWGFKNQMLEEFLAMAKDFRPVPIDLPRPSKQIADYLIHSCGIAHGNSLSAETIKKYRSAP